MAVNGLFIGITSIDVVYNSSLPLPEDNEKIIINDFEMRIGGPAAKAAMTCAELGGNATLITCLGDSMLSKSAKEHIESYNINNTAITRDGDSILYKYPGEKGEIPVDKVENCNTSGAGDVFHGAFCYYYYHEKNDYVEALTNASTYATNYVKKPQ